MLLSYIEIIGDLDYFIFPLFMVYFINHGQKLVFIYCVYVYVCVLVAHSYLTLCKAMDCSLPGSSVHGILQARILEWAAISYLKGLPNPGIKTRSPALQADSLLSEPPGKP